MNILNTIRYSVWFSRIVRHPLQLLSRVFAGMIKQIQNKIKINTGVVSYYGYSLTYPRDVGIGALSNIYWKGEKGFEATTGQLLVQLFKQSDVFFDVGSNYGFYSVLAKKVNPRLSVTAFEPNTLMAKQNERFRLSNGVEYILDSRGLSEAPSELDFFIPQREGIKEVTTSSFNKNFFFNKKQKMEVSKVICTTLDDAWDTFKIKGASPNVCIKIDVEGYEINVLRGASNVLESVRPIIVCEVEMAPGRNPVLGLVYDKDFEVYHIQPSGLVRILEADLRTHFGKERDFLFMPSEKSRFNGVNYVPIKLFTKLMGHHSGL